MVAALAGQAAAVEVTTLYTLQVLGGQYFFRQEKGSLTGNASGMIAPAVKFNEQWSILPSLSSSYQGTKQVVDLVGSGSLFQEQMDHRMGLRTVYSPDGSQWRLKPNFSFRYQLLKETKGEKWFNSLFDYYKWSGGVEAEYVYYDPFSIRFGFDYFETRFPNYTSLESAAALQFQGQDLARELVGDRILDTRNVTGFFGVDGPVMEWMVAEGNLGVTYQDFYNQPIVDETGLLTTRLRRDVMTTLGGALRMPHQLAARVRMMATVEGAVAYNTSNQASYDAQRTKYIPFYYNYGEIRGGPTFRLFMGPREKPAVASLSGMWSYRRYPHRPIQDASGSYNVSGRNQTGNIAGDSFGAGDKAFHSPSLDTLGWVVSSTLNYPMAQNFGLIFNVQYGRTYSNQKFEQLYAYNYRVTNYLFGFKYEY